jgi:hypothetical protein
MKLLLFENAKAFARLNQDVRKSAEKFFPCKNRISWVRSGNAGWETNGFCIHTDIAQQEGCS